MHRVTTMPYSSTNELPFLSTVQSWIEASGEILAMIRFHASAGAKSFEFFRSLEAFQDRLQDVPPRTCVIAFREPQLPLRGRADNEFIRQALTLMPDGAEFLVVALEKTTIGTASWFHDAAGESHAELVGALRDASCHGKLVAVGLYPPWLKDNEAVISAVVPDGDGIVTTGVY
jgi:hypothetical protein